MTQDFTKEFALFFSVGDLVKEVRDFVDKYKQPYAQPFNTELYYILFKDIIRRIDEDMKDVEYKYADI